MPLESATYISQLVNTNPTGSDDYATADDHLRLTKAVLLNQFPNLGAVAVTASAAELNVLEGFTGNVNDLNILSGAAVGGLTAAELLFLANVTSDVQTQLDAKAATATTMTAGNGLTGGGSLAANRTFNVGAGVGILANANDVALDTAHVRNVDHSAIALTAGNGLTGGGTIDANRTFNVGAGAGITVNADDVALDTAHVRNVDHSAVSITAGVGLTGGGTITSTRTLDMNLPGLTDLNSIPTRAMYIAIYNGSAHRRVDMEDFNRVDERTFSASDTLNIDDQFKVMRSTGASNVTMTVPPNADVAFTNGTIIGGERHGTGTFHWAAGTGVTLRSADGNLGHRVRYSGTSIRKIATNEWMVTGDLGA